MIIAVATQNKAKAKGLKDAVTELPLFDAVHPQYSYHSVKSGVSNTPLSIEETITGATNRAQALFEDDGVVADYYVGLEGAVARFGGSSDTFIFGYVHIIHTDGTSSGGFSPMMPIPHLIAKQLYEDKKDLGEIAALLSGDDRIRHSWGSFGYFSDGMITRDESFKLATKMAFVPFANPKYH